MAFSYDEWKKNKKVKSEKSEQTPKSSFDYDAWKAGKTAETAVRSGTNNYDFSAKPSVRDVSAPVTADNWEEMYSEPLTYTDPKNNPTVNLAKTAIGLGEVGLAQNLYDTAVMTPSQKEATANVLEHLTEDDIPLSRYRYQKPSMQDRLHALFERSEAAANSEEKYAEEYGDYGNQLTADDRSGQFVSMLLGYYGRNEYDKADKYLADSVKVGSITQEEADNYKAYAMYEHFNTYDPEKKLKNLRKLKTDAAQNYAAERFANPNEEGSAAQKQYEYANKLYSDYADEYYAGGYTDAYNKAKEKWEALPNTSIEYLDDIINSANEEAERLSQMPYTYESAVELGIELPEYARDEVTISKKIDALYDEARSTAYYAEGTKLFLGLSKELQDELVKAVEEGDSLMRYDKKTTLRKKVGKDYEKIAKTLEAAYDEMKQAETQEGAAKFAWKYPVLGSLASVFNSAVGGVLGVADLAGQAVGNAIVQNNAPINFNAPLQTNAQLRGTQRAVVSNELSTYFESDIGKKVAPFIYQTVMSSVDSMVASYIPGGAATSAIVISTGAAYDAAKDAHDRGASDGQALLFGLVNGIFEELFETVSIEQLKIFREKPVGDIKSLFLRMFKSSVTNASEEFFTEVGDYVADYLINGGASESAQLYEQRYNEYIQTMSEEEANKKAREDVAWDFLKRVGLAAVGGGLQGFGMAGIDGLVHWDSNAIRIDNKQKEIIRLGKKAGGDTAVEANRVAKLRRSGEATAEDYRNLKLRLVDDVAITGEEIADVAKRAGASEDAARIFDKWYHRNTPTNTEMTAIKNDANALQAFNQLFGANVTAEQGIGAFKNAIREAVSGRSDDYRSMTLTARALYDKVKADNGMTATQNAEFMAAYYRGYNGMEMAYDNGELSESAYKHAFEEGRIARSERGTVVVSDGVTLNRAERRAMESMAKKLDMAIYITPNATIEHGATIRGYSVDRKANAVYVAADAKVTITKNGVKQTLKGTAAARMVILGHELTHRLQQMSPERYNAFKNFALEYWGKDTSNATAEQYMENLHLSREAAEDEIAADYAMQKLFTDENVIKRITQSDNKVAQFFRNVIEWLKSKFGITSELDTAERLWREAYESAETKSEASNEKKSEVKTESVSNVFSNSEASSQIAITAEKASEYLRDIGFSKKKADKYAQVFSDIFSGKEIDDNTIREISRDNELVYEIYGYAVDNMLNVIPGNSNIEAVESVIAGVEEYYANMNANAKQTQTEDGVDFIDNHTQFSKVVTDKETLAFLEKQDTITTYKTMQIFEGKLYPPMAARIRGGYEDASVLGKWEQSTEHPELIKNGKFKLDKGKGNGSLEAAYNPYMHSSNLVLNDQFTGAYARNNLVTVECVVPKSEVSSGYHAEYAKDSVGWHPWHTGTVAGQLRKSKGVERQVFLSRWIMPVRIVPDAEVAAMYKDLLEGTSISVPDNVVTPSLLNELKKAGVSIHETGRVNNSYSSIDVKNSAVYNEDSSWVEQLDIPKSAKNIPIDSIPSNVQGTIKRLYSSYRSEFLKYFSDDNLQNAWAFVSTVSYGKSYSYLFPLRDDDFSNIYGHRIPQRLEKYALETSLIYLKEARYYVTERRRNEKEIDAIPSTENPGFRPIPTIGFRESGRDGGTVFGDFGRGIENGGRVSGEGRDNGIYSESVQEDKRSIDEILDEFRSIIERLDAEEASKAGSQESAFSTPESKTKFSMASNIEETDRMIAWHNISSSSIDSALELGGLAMPSFAVKPANNAHTSYGDISVIARKESIAPNGKTQMIYGGDAWTPTFPSVDYKISNPASNELYDKVVSIIKNHGADANSVSSADFYPENIASSLQHSNGNFSRAYSNNKYFRLAYLLESGKLKSIPMEEKTYSADTDALIEIGKQFDVRRMRELGSSEIMKHEQEIRKILRDFYAKKKGDVFADYLYGEELPFYKLDVIVRDAYVIKRDGLTSDIDYDKVGEIARETIDKGEGEADYERWLSAISKNLVEKKGIRNDKDMFTPSGNRRTFDQLHYDYNLANIVRAMQGQAKQGRTQFLSGSGSVKGAALKAYKSIEDVRADLGRISTELSEEGKKAYADFADKVFDVAEKTFSDPFSGSDAIAEILSNAKSEMAIERYLNREYKFLETQDGKDLHEIAKEIYNIGQEANKLPMEYFEAKLYRAFSFDEAAAVVVPDTLPQETVDKLREQGANVVVYENGNDEDRLEKVNSVEGVRFSSVSNSTESTDELILQLMDTYKTLDDVVKSDKKRGKLNDRAEKDLRLAEMKLTEELSNKVGIDSKNVFRMRKAVMSELSRVMLANGGVTEESVDRIYAIANNLAGRTASDATDKAFADSVNKYVEYVVGGDNEIGRYLRGKKASVEKVKEDIAGMVESFGAIKRGEKAVRDIVMPESTERGKHLSQTVRTVMEAGATTDELIPDIEQLVADGSFSYTRYTDKAAIEDANSYITKNGYEAAKSKWMIDVGKGIVSKENTAIGWALYNAASNAHDTEGALNILSAMVIHQRNGAQAVQATRILKKLNPSYQLYAAQRSIASMQEELNNRYGNKNAPELKIDTDLAEQFQNAKTQEERDKILKEIYKDIGRQIPSRFIDKWNAWRYLSMLANPRTHIRNIVGNAGFAPIVMAKNMTATALENMVSFVSGGKIARTKSFISGKGGLELLGAAFDDFALVEEVALGGGKYSDSALAQKSIEEGRAIFKSKALEALRKFNGAALDKEDVWFSKPHYAYAMAQYCKANGITAEQIRKGEGIDEARRYAIKEAQKATYRDTNAVSVLFSNLGKMREDGEYKGVKKAWNALVEGVIPFRKTPANILARGIEYSPIGFLKSLTVDAKKVSQGKMTATEMIDDISAGLTGTGLVALGFYLASQGILRGKGGDDDKDKELQKLMGRQDYSIEIGNTSITLDWLAPESMPLFIGANLAELYKEDKELTFEDGLNSLTNITEPMLSMSCLQGLNDLIESVSYSKTEGIWSVAANAATSYLTQGVPTILGQIERTGEGIRYTSFRDKNGFLPTEWQGAISKVTAKMPGVDYNQIPYVDAWGREQSTGNVATRAANNFLNPAYVSSIKVSPMEEELSRLYNATGESVFPSRVDKYVSVNGEKIYLSAEDYVSYQKKAGTMSYGILTKLTASQAYKSMDDTDKAKAVSDVYAYAKALAKAQVSPYVLDGWVAKAQKSCSKLNIPEDVYISAYVAKSGIEGLKDNDGNTIANSKGLLIMQMVYEIPGLTKQQRNAMMQDFGVGKKVIDYSKSEVDKALKSMR